MRLTIFCLLKTILNCLCFFESRLHTRYCDGFKVFWTMTSRILFVFKFFLINWYSCTCSCSYRMIFEILKRDINFFPAAAQLGEGYPVSNDVLSEKYCDPILFWTGFVVVTFLLASVALIILFCIGLLVAYKK